MISSTDVSQLFAAQQQQFGAANFYSQTIGISNPALNVGAVGWGSGKGGMQQVPTGAQGVSPPPPVFSYAGGGPFGPGYGPGGRLAGSVMSGIGAAATIGGVGLGMASMFGPMRAMAPLVDPISGFMAGYGGMSARGIMGGLAGAALPLAAGYAVSRGVGAVIQGGQQQQQISQQLGNFNFINPQSRTGMGFSRQDSQDIGSNIRSLANVPEMLTSVEELTRMLPQMRRMGVMQGVRDSSEFNRRFKETITTIRDMSKILGSTLEEASQFFEQNRLMGITSRQGQLQNVMQTQYTSARTGMSIGETIGMETRGAQFARSQGARGVFGAQASRSFAERIQGGIDQGFINAETLADTTGTVGPEAAGIGSGIMQMRSNQFMDSSPGQLAMAGMLKRNKKGVFEFDAEAMERFNSGNMSMGELKKRAASLGRAGKIAFMGPQGKNLRAAVGGSLDISRYMESLVGAKGEGAALLEMQEMMPGITAPELTMMTGMAKAGAGDDERRLLTSLRSREMAIAEQTDPVRLWEKTKTKIDAKLFGGLRQTGSEIANYVQRGWELFADEWADRHIMNIDKAGAKVIKTALAGGGSKDAGLARMVAVSKYAGGSSSTRTISEYFGEAARHLGIKDNLPGSTGRTEEEEMANLEKLTNRKGTHLENLLSWSGEGKLASASSTAAMEAMKNLQLRLATETDYQEAHTTPARRFEMNREAIASQFAKTMVGKPGHKTEEVELAKAILEGRVDMQRWADKWKTGTSEQQETGLLAQAGIDAQKAHGLADVATGVVLAVPQDAKLGAGVNKGLMNREALRRARLVGQVDTLRKEAEGDVSSALPLTGGIIRKNAVVRGLVNDILSSGSEANKADMLRALAVGGQEGIDVLAKRGYPVTPEDMQDAKKVLSEARANPGAARGAIGKMHSVVAYETLQAVKERMVMAGESVSASAASTAKLGDVSRKLLTELGSSMQQYDPSSPDTHAQDRMNESVASLTDAYSNKSTTKEEKAAIIQGAGVLGPLISSLSAGRGAFGKSKYITSAALRRQYNLSEEDIGMMPSLGSFGEHGLVNSEKMRATIAGAVTGLKVGDIVASGAVTGQEKMMGTFDRMNVALDKVVTVLTVMANKEVGPDAVTAALNGSRVNAPLHGVDPGSVSSQPR